MKIITPARLHWTSANEPYSDAFSDVYFSAVDGQAETQHVFIDGNQLRERWRSLEHTHFVVGETGFGTGLNFITAWQLWDSLTPHTSHLTYLSVEKFPLTAVDLQRAASRWPDLKPWYEQLLAQYPVLTPGFHLLRFGRVSLLLLLGDATDLYAQVETKVDAWFLDGFAPAKNPDLWQPALLTQLARLSKAGTTLSTFSAAGEMRRNLAAVGFQVEKQPGFGNKRDMTVARFDGTTASAPLQTPWHCVRQPHAEPAHVTVIGAGIAGSTIAYALAMRGIQVTVIEKNPEAAMEASGNRQAMLYSKWGANDDTLSLFNLCAYLYALRFYPDFHRCGVLHLDWENTDFLKHYPDIARELTREEASDLAGIDVNRGGLFFHQAGWLHPGTVCKQLLQHPNITTQFNTALLALPENEAVVITTGHHANTWPQTAALPLKPLRGQVSHGRPTEVSRQLKTVISGDGYIAPAHGDVQSFGATYTPKCHDLSVTSAEHEENINKLAKSSTALAAVWAHGNHLDGGRAHFRATTPDYLPLCGPVPDHEAFLEDYAALRKDAKRLIPLEGRYHPHLYICAGLGSRGMAYAPLCAEIMVSHVLKTPPPLPLEVMKALHPARFVIRGLSKNR